MLFTQKDIELLKLICWCKNIPSPAGTIFQFLTNEAELLTLESLDFITRSKDGKNIRPKTLAYELLEMLGYSFKSDIKTQTKETVIQRRNIQAQILLTFYMAGVSVFNDTLPNHIRSPMYIASFAAKQKDDNKAFGNTRFYGIFVTPQEAFIVYYVDDIGIFFQNELTLFHNFVHGTGVSKTSVIFMGTSTSSIGAMVLKDQDMKEPQKKSKTFAMDSFGKVLVTTSLPVYFIPIGTVGAQILRFMVVENYREIIAQGILKKNFKPPYKELYDTDTIHFKPPNNPAIVSVDTNIKRIDRAIEQAKTRGFKGIAIYALSEQVPFLKSRYHDGFVEILSIHLDSLKEALPFDTSLYMPPSTPFMLSDGRCLDVSDFTLHRKVGK